MEIKENEIFMLLSFVQFSPSFLALVRRLLKGITIERKSKQTCHLLFPALDPMISKAKRQKKRIRRRGKLLFETSTSTHSSKLNDIKNALDCHESI